jgi:hypothetical protein
LSFAHVLGCAKISQIHTFILLLLIIILSIRVFTSGLVSSPGELYDLIVEAGIKSPASGNQDGSYLTVHSHLAARFALSQLLGNFGLCIMDTGFWQKAFAADVSATVVGHLRRETCQHSADYLCNDSLDIFSGLSAISQSLGLWEPSLELGGLLSSICRNSRSRYVHI